MAGETVGKKKIYVDMSAIKWNKIKENEIAIDFLCRIIVQLFQSFPTNQNQGHFLKVCDLTVRFETAIIQYDL